MEHKLSGRYQWGTDDKIFLTIGFESPIISWSVERKPFSRHNEGFKSKSFATHIAAVFLTYGLSSYCQKLLASASFCEIQIVTFSVLRRGSSM